MSLAKDQTSQIEKILYRFKDSKNITDLMYSLLQEVSRLEDTFQQLYDGRNLASAVGVQLDQIGKIIGEDRQGRDDEEYRKYLYIRTFINGSNGTTKELEEIIFRTEDATFVQVFNHYPASIYIYAKTPNIPDDSLKDLITEMLPAGVSLGYIGYFAEEELSLSPQPTGESLLGSSVLGGTELIALSNGAGITYEMGALELGGGELNIVDPLDLPIFNAFIPYDKVLAPQLLDLSNGTNLILSDQTPLLVSTETTADYIEESFLSENPEYEVNALHSRPIENL